MDNFTPANRFTPHERGERQRVECLEGGIGLRTNRVYDIRCNASSTRLSTEVDEPLTSWFERSAIASNTGCTSDGELAITLRMSAVAVCRSSASCVSLNSRAFSIAITAWSAKVCCSASSSSVKAASRSRYTIIAPIALPSRRSGVPQIVRMPAARAADRGPIRHRRIDDCRDRECGFAGFRDRPSPAGSRPARSNSRGGLAPDTSSTPAPTRTVLNPFLALGDADGDAGGIEEVLSGFGDPLQRVLGIAVGVGDGAQDFGAGFLALGGGAQFVLADGN